MTSPELDPGSVDAIVLVGGKGTRLRPLTLSAPKPMLPTAGVPFLTHLLARIREAGITHVVLGTSYQAEVFEAHFGSGTDLGLDIDYVVEDEPLGTGGAIGNVADKLRGDTAMIFNGDILSGCDLTALLAQHRAAQADVTLHLSAVEDPTTFGCVPTDSERQVLGFYEKDPNPVSNQINAGTYVFSRAVIDAIPTGRPVSVERETFPGLLAAGATVSGYLDQAYWRDLGTPADFVAGSSDLVLGVAPSPVLIGRTGDALVLPAAQVAADAVLTGGATVGAGCVIGAGAVIDGAVLFDGVQVAPGATVRRSVVGRDVVIGAGVLVADAVIGDRARIGDQVELQAGVRIWPEVELPAGSVRFSADT